MLAAISALWSGVKASYVNPHTKDFGVGVNNKIPYRGEPLQLAAGLFNSFFYGNKEKRYSAKDCAFHISDWDVPYHDRDISGLLAREKRTYRIGGREFREGSQGDCP